MEAWKARSKSLNPLAPQAVPDGPIFEHAQHGDDVNLMAFPAPKWHERDGGRYIGTAAVTITRDPNDGSVNIGTYRVMLVDRNHAAIFIASGKDSYRHRQKYFTQGRSCPVAISFGHHPVIFLVGSFVVPPEFSEYDYAGALLNEPIQVVEGPLTGLPVPAYAELVMEGEILPDQKTPEGPFGEWTGYYASGQRQEYLVEAKALYFREAPILLGSPPSKPPSETTWARNLIRSAELEESLARMGVPDVKAAWFHPAGGSRFLIVVAIRQRYPGHAKQTALAVTSSQIGAFLGRYVIVVDEDIDVTDLNEVMWAVTTRGDPERSIEIRKGCWSSVMDPALRKGSPELNSRALIDACRPYEWMAEFPPVVGTSPELMAKVLVKWPFLSS
jgi:4-hydroxy-3-polyprenylbenzoate decarboxylase